MRVPLAAVGCAGLIAAVVSAQGPKQIQIYAGVLDGRGSPAASLAVGDVHVMENGADAAVVSVERLDSSPEWVGRWPSTPRGTYETFNNASRLASLLPEIAGKVAAAVERSRRQFRITATRPAAAAGAIGKVDVGVKSPLVTAGLSFDGPVR